MSRPTYYRWLFRAAALWSWALTMGLFFDERHLADAFQFRTAPGILVDMTMLPVFLFGVAYWWVSRDITRNHAIPAVGAMGGLLTFLIFVVRVLSGDPAFLILPAVFDLLFGLLFLEFLLWSRRGAEAV